MHSSPRLLSVIAEILQSLDPERLRQVAHGLMAHVAERSAIIRRNELLAGYNIFSRALTVLIARARVSHNLCHHCALTVATVMPTRRLAHHRPMLCR